MPLYFFDIRCDAFDAEDVEGEECSDLGEAKAGALRAAGELIRNELELGGLPVSGWIDIADASRRRVLSLPLRSAAC
jgi:hypothetical protein